MKQLLDVLFHLQNSGNTIVIIEHNLDVIKVADWIIDLGPHGGDKGSTIVGVGTPEKIASTKGSFTGEFLAPLLNAVKAKAKPKTQTRIKHFIKRSQRNESRTTSRANNPHNRQLTQCNKQLLLRNPELHILSISY